MPTTVDEPTDPEEEELSQSKAPPDTDAEAAAGPRQNDSDEQPDAQQFAKQAVGKPTPVGVSPVRPAPPADNPQQRHQDAYKAVDEAATKRFQERDPFLPASWQPAMPTEVYAKAAQISDEQAREKAATDRANAHADLLAQNADREAKMRGAGQRFYTDPYGQLQPILETGTNKPLYTPSTKREQGINPQTSEPAWMTMDKYGQAQYQRPNLIANPDPSDTKLYYDFNGQTVPAGEAKDLMAHPDFKVARAAMQAVHKQRAAAWKEAIAPMQDVVNGTTAALDTAKAQHDDLQNKADLLNKQVGDIDANIPALQGDALMQAQANRAALSAQLDQITAQQTPLKAAIDPKTGTLARAAKDAKLHLAIFTAKSKHDAYSDSADERRAILKAQGKPEEGDATLQSITAAQNAYGGAIDKFGTQAQPQPAAAAGTPPTGEPYEMAAQGVKGIGGVSIQDFARRYGSGNGPVNPQQLLDMKQHSQELKEMLADPKTALDAKLKDSLTQQQTYLDQFYATRFAKLDAPTQNKLNEYINRQTTSAAGAAGRAGVAAAPGIGGAIGGGEAGATIGAFGGPLAPVTVPAGAAIGALIGSVMADKVARKAAEKFAPETYAKFQDYSAKDWEQHPVTVAAADMGANLAAFKFSSPAQAVRAVGALEKLAKGVALNDGEKAAAKALAVQAGLAVGSAVAAPLIDGKKVDPMQALASAAQMMIFGEQRFGGHGAATPTPEAENAASRLEAMKTAVPTDKAAPAFQEVPGSGTPEAPANPRAAQAPEGPAFESARVFHAADKTQAARDAADREFQNTPEGLAVLNAKLSSIEKAQARAQAEGNQRQVDFLRAKAEELQQTIKGGQLAAPEETTFSGDAARDQATLAETRRGESERERTRLAVQQQTPAVGDGSIPAGTELSKQAQELAAREGEPLPAQVAKKTTPQTTAQASESAPAEKSAPTPEADATRYQEIHAQMSDLLKTGKANSPEFHELWRENEEIKNRNEGMPPGQKAAEPVKTTEEKPSNAIPIESAGAPAVREAPENREGVRGENPVDQGASGAREAGALESPAAVRPEVKARQAGEKSAAEEGQWQQLMKAKAADVKTLADDLSPEQAAKFLHRLDLAPGDNPAVRKVLSERMAAPTTQHGEVKGEQIKGEWHQFAPEAKGLGIPRAEMPQVKAEHRGALTQFLKGQGIEHKLTLVRPTDLKPSQNEYSEAKVEKARKFEGGDRSIIVSSDNHVVDGHHQWVAALHDAPNKPMKVIRLNKPIREVLEKVKEFPSAETAGGATSKTEGIIPGVPQTKPGEQTTFDHLIGKLQSLKTPYDPTKLHSPTPDVLYHAARNAALDAAILALKAGRSIAQSIQIAIGRFREKYPGATKEHVDGFEREMRENLGAPASVAAKTAPAEATKQGPAAAPAKAPETTGIAHRVSEASGMAAERGEGISAKASTEQGREKYTPEKALEAIKKFENDPEHAVSAEMFQQAKAHKEALAKATNAADDKFGFDSPERKAAWDAETKWIDRIKPLQTEWHKGGQAQQGETEIDTGTFHGLARAYRESTGKDFTPKQETDAKRISGEVKKRQDAADAAKDKLLKAVDDKKAATKESVAAAEKIIIKHKSGATWTPEEAKALWHVAKANYLEQGVNDVNDIRAGLATDYGLSKADIFTGLASPKGVRTLTDEMYAKMAERRRVINLAKQWLADSKYPGWLQAAKATPKFFFNLATFGHGSVGMITHAGNQMFDPMAVKDYWQNFGRQFLLMGWHEAKAFGGPGMGGYHERMMQDLVRDPNFIKAKRAGLANDPFKYQDDYQNSAAVKFFKDIGLSGNRGFDALKLFRQDRFNRRWEALPASLKTPEMAKLIADLGNHETGVVKSSVGGDTAANVMFAPKLEASRWAFLVGDPAKAAKTFANWRKETPEARHAAIMEVRQKALLAATYFGALVINQGLLDANGSEEKVNFDNPRRGDWLSFKVAGHNLGIISPMIGTVRFLANLYHDATAPRSQFENMQSSRFQEASKDAGQYIRGKEAPFAKVATDAAFQADFKDRPMPWSKDKISFRAKNQGVTEPYGYGEYAAKNLPPIPVQEAITDAWRSQGMDEDQINRWMRALTVAAVVGGTGARLTEDTGGEKNLIDQLRGKADATVHSALQEVHRMVGSGQLSKQAGMKLIDRANASAADKQKFKDKLKEPAMAQ